MSALRFDHEAKDQKLVQDHKRERDHKYKWAHGEAVLIPGRSSKRPAKGPTKCIDSDIIRSRGSPGLEFQARPHTKMSRKQTPRFDNDNSTSDSSAEEDIQEVSAAPEPDVGISYSFDAPRGPTEGGTILGMAITKAVEKFETKATEKLVKDEYEVIAKEPDDFRTGYAADEDDFELL